MHELDALLHRDKPGRIWSPYQEAVFESSGPTIVQAVAGAAKTTTTIEKANRTGGNALILAFNKNIATDISSKVIGITVKTFNALGHQMLMRKMPGAKLDAWRNSKRVRQVLSPNDFKDYGQQVVRAISLSKANAIFEPSHADFINLIEAYELDVPYDMIPVIAKVALRVYGEMEKNVETFDFDDQLFLPIKNNWLFPAFDYVYIDEAQDLSLVQHMMVQQLCARGASPTAVGDRNQAIYGFRGATHDSMDNMKKLFNMQELPLSICYRCGKDIVGEAQLIVPQMEAWEKAPQGKVTRFEGEVKPDLFIHGDLVVCRNNAPIFSLALQFIREGKSCQVLSNFLETLETFIEEFDARSSKDFRVKLEAWYKKEKESCVANNRLGRLEGIQDRYEVLTELSNAVSTTGEIISILRRLAAATHGPKIATVHKAKGLEAKRCFILRPDLMPSPRATTESQLKAEANLRYVAITRAQEELIYLPPEVA